MKSKRCVRRPASWRPDWSNVPRTGRHRVGSSACCRAIRGPAIDARRASVGIFRGYREAPSAGILGLASGARDDDRHEAFSLQSRCAGSRAEDGRSNARRGVQLDDPDHVLGMAPCAGGDAMGRADRALAKRHHPDLAPGDTRSEDWFKAVAAANDPLSEPDECACFDRSEIGATGPEAETWSRDDLGDIFASGFPPRGEANSSGRCDTRDRHGGLIGTAGSRP